MWLCVRGLKRPVCFYTFSRVLVDIINTNDYQITEYWPFLQDTFIRLILMLGKGAFSF